MLRMNEGRIQDKISKMKVKANQNENIRLGEMSQIEERSWDKIEGKMLLDRVRWKDLAVR
jgi:hypothetical protein